ncbi:hypothetical protein [Haladaptatus sp. DYF46]|uniref:hypothetical protein n=1 Tax=Haladaptatus sp. DYF46 TaxID=2886041 RepID=UPI001E30E98D|nr:hypothetical protein [Haladaptatus sp. DYF46]
MVDKRTTSTRRRTLKMITTSMGISAIPSVSTAKTHPQKYSEFKSRLNKLKYIHGDVKNVDVKEIHEEKPKKVRKTLIFADGHEETIFFAQKIGKPHIATWNNNKYRLTIEPVTDFDPKQITPALHQEALQASSDGLPSTAEEAQASSEWLNVTIGNDEIFTSATHGRAKTKNDWLGTAKADYDGTEGQFLTRATFLGIPGAYTQTWISLYVNSAPGEPNDKHVDFDISSFWDAGWLGAGGSGAWKVGVYTYDYESGTFIDKEVVDKAQVAPADFRVDHGSDVTTLGVNAEAGKHYGIGIYAGGSSGSVGLQSSTVDLWPGNDFDGGARWSLIDMNWS